MKIHYYSHKFDRSVSPDFVNFYDDLNETLWDQLFPGLLDTDAAMLSRLVHRFDTARTLSSKFRNRGTDRTALRGLRATAN